MPNEAGRVLGGDGLPVPGVYCAGWIKRGPSGVIGTKNKDATDTKERHDEDSAAGKHAHGVSADEVDEILAESGVRVVTQAGWESIDHTERTAGEPHGRPRVKLAEWDALLAAAGLDRAPS